MNSELKVHMQQPEFTVIGKKIYCNFVCNFANNSFVAYGIAQCSKDDKFDYNYGAKLARVRAEKNAYKTARKLAVKTLIRCVDAQKSLERFIDKANHCITHDEVYIIDLLKD